MPRLRKRRAVPLLPLYAFKAWAGSTFTLLVLVEMGLEDAYARELGRVEKTNCMWVVLNALHDCFLVRPAA